MGVRSPYGARPAVKHEAHRALLAGALGVEIHKDYFLLDLLHIAVGDDEGIVGITVQREAAYQVQHAHVAERRFEHADTAAGALRREVCWTEYAAPLVKIRSQLRARPGVIA